MSPRLWPLPFLVLAGCHPHRWQVRSIAPDRPLQSVALAPTTFLQDLERLDPVPGGTTVGSLQFSGGVIRDPELGPVSAEIVESRGSHARKQVSVHLDRTARMILERTGARVIDHDGPTLVPARREVRGVARGDGRDNQALPRFDLEAVGAGPLSLPVGVDALVVPVVVSYYEHNGGWFPGQTWGCAAGARYRVFVGTWAADGTPLAWTDLDVKYLSDSVSQPTPSELDAWRLELESALEGRLRRTLWRDRAHGGPKEASR